MRRLLAELRDDLTPDAERLRAIVRITVAVALVVVISSALSVPFAAVSAYMVFFVSKVDRVTTFRTAVGIALGMSVSIPLTIVLFLATVDNPPLRYVSMAGVLFLGMWLSRITAVGPLAFMLGFAVCVTQAVVDDSLVPELFVRATMWLWVAVVYAAALTAAVNSVLFPARPEHRFASDWSRWVRAIRDELESIAAGAPRPMRTTAVVRNLATSDLTPHREALKLAARSDPAIVETYRPDAIDRLAEVARTTACLSLAANAPLTPEQRQRVRAIARVLSNEASPSEIPSEPPPSSTRVDPLVRSVESALARFVNAEPGTPAEQPPTTRHRFFVADAFTNPAHTRFAFKAALAAVVCYTAYTGLDWFGIHTALITCVFVVLGSTGATLHKSALRVTGCLVGGSLGLLSLVYVVPQFDSVAGLVLLVAGASTLAAWVSTGSERLSYAGMQIALAFFLCVLQGDHPKYDLTIFRDRFVGILLGVLVTGAIFTCLWPERASTERRVSLGAAARTIARLQRAVQRQTPAREPALRQMWTTLRTQLSRAEAFARLERFEQTDAETDPVQEVERAREAALAATTTAGPACTALTPEYMLGIADRIEGGGPWVEP